jgi:hypothetical protein
MTKFENSLDCQREKVWLVYVHSVLSLWSYCAVQVAPKFWELCVTLISYEFLCSVFGEAENVIELFV